VVYFFLDPIFDPNVRMHVYLRNTCIKNLSQEVKVLRALGPRMGQRGWDSAVEWLQEVGVFYTFEIRGHYRVKPNLANDGIRPELWGPSTSGKPH
jgi:hypothetical protein